MRSINDRVMILLELTANCDFSATVA